MENKRAVVIKITKPVVEENVVAILATRKKIKIPMRLSHLKGMGPKLNIFIAPRTTPKKMINKSFSSRIKRSKIRNMSIFPPITYKVPALRNHLA